MGQVELSRAFIWSVAGQEFPMRESLAKTLGKGGPTSMGPCFPPLSLSPTLLASINLVSPDCTSLQWARWLSSGSKFLQAWARQARDSMSMQKDGTMPSPFSLGPCLFPSLFLRTTSLSVLLCSSISSRLLHRVCYLSERVSVCNPGWPQNHGRAGHDSPCL